MNNRFGLVFSRLVFVTVIAVFFLIYADTNFASDGMLGIPWKIWAFGLLVIMGLFQVGWWRVVRFRERGD